MEAALTVPPNPDRDALVQVGERVRTRLAADPSVYRAPAEKAEIYAVTGFLSPDECAQMITMIEDVARPSTLFEDTHIEGYRTSWSGDIDGSDTFVRMIERRLSDLTGIDLPCGEAVQGQRYQPGQEYREHCDWFDTRAAYWQDEIRRGGQRSWTAMAYLNAVEEGGETEFLNLGIKIEPQPGVLLLWNNVTEDGEPNRHTIHYARKVERGVKYVITKWFRTRPWS
jgi:prolyl 4-hydroxylase